MSGQPPADTLRIAILPTKHPGRYQVSLEAPAIPLLGGPALRPESLISAEAIGPIRRAYEEQIALFHELEVAGMPAPAVDPQPLILLGRRVAALLPVSARQGIVAAVRRAQGRGRPLRILLEATAETRLFLSVPWELMVLPLKGGADEGGEDFVLQDARISLIRQVRGAGQQTRPRLVRPLTVQAFLAQPRGGEPIDWASSYGALERALSPEAAAAAWFAGDGTLPALAKRLRAANPQILHILCHGQESQANHGTRHDLLFTHPDGFVQRVSAFELAPMLSLAPDLQVVVLQACHTGTTPSAATDGEGERRAVESIALALVREGVLAVVAMQGEVGQTAAGAFVEALYAVLADEGDLDRAVAAGRAAMRAVRGTADWSLPVVYQGSGPAETVTWYTRLADRMEAATRQPATARTLRGLFLAWGLVLLTGGIARWLLTPAALSADLAALTAPLAAWLGVGLVGPAIVATAQRGARGRDDLPAGVRRAARYAQWGGAYLGYALAGLLGLSVWVSLWALGLLAALPAALATFLFVGVLLWALWCSYVVARSQWRSALAVAPVDTWSYTGLATAIILIAAAILLAAPLSVFVLPDAWLLRAEPAALALAGAIISLVFGLDG